MIPQRTACQGKHISNVVTHSQDKHRGKNRTIRHTDLAFRALEGIIRVQVHIAQQLKESSLQVQTAARDFQVFQQLVLHMKSTVREAKTNRGLSAAAPVCTGSGKSPQRRRSFPLWTPRRGGRGGCGTPSRREGCEGQTCQPWGPQPGDEESLNTKTSNNRKWGRG